MTTHYLGIKEVADLLGIQSSTLSHYVSKGMLPPPRRHNRHRSKSNERLERKNHLNLAQKQTRAWKS